MLRFIVRNIEIADLPCIRRFRCDNASMEAFLHDEAYIKHINYEGITKVVIDKETSELVAYYTLKCDRVIIYKEEMSVKPKQYPCIEISRLAVKRSWQMGRKGLHLGTHLMGDILTFIKEDLASNLGCRFVTLQSVPERVKWYSEDFNFMFG